MQSDDTTPAEPRDILFPRPIFTLVIVGFPHGLELSGAVLAKVGARLLDDEVVQGGVSSDRTRVWARSARVFSGGLMDSGAVFSSRYSMVWMTEMLRPVGWPYLIAL